jgi:hypothetical protein
MKGKKKFEVRFYKDADGKVKKGVFIDNEVIEYSIDVESLKKIAELGTEYKKAAHLDIEKHFLECISDTVGRKITPEDFWQATKTGWI